MFCCAGLASICRSPFVLVRGCAVSIGKGNRRQLSSYRLLQYGLVKRFSTSRPIIFSGDVPALGAPNGFFRPPPVRPPPKSTGFHFPRQPSTIVSSRTEFQNRSPDLDQHQPTHRPPDKPPDAVSLVAFCRRHNLARPALFLHSGQCSLHEGT